MITKTTPKGTQVTIDLQALTVTTTIGTLNIMSLGRMGALTILTTPKGNVGFERDSQLEGLINAALEKKIDEKTKEYTQSPKYLWEAYDAAVERAIYAGSSIGPAKPTCPRP